MTFGSTSLTQAWGSERGVKLARLVIHPDYWEDVKQHGNPYDLALIKTDKVDIILEMTNLHLHAFSVLAGYLRWWRHGVCGAHLPPAPGPGAPQHAGGRRQQHSQVEAQGVMDHLALIKYSVRYKPEWYKKRKSPLVPFEDMDCFTNNLPWLAGYRHDTEIQVCTFKKNIRLPSKDV